ncbi:hypothetical protein K1719_024594 [Acacia pycnantha]|nr:hypothetical protein K1719_024594 [Acacia pycnantha]
MENHSKRTPAYSPSCSQQEVQNSNHTRPSLNQFFFLSSYFTIILLWHLLLYYCPSPLLPEIFFKALETDVIFFARPLGNHVPLSQMALPVLFKKEENCSGLFPFLWFCCAIIIQTTLLYAIKVLHLKGLPFGKRTCVVYLLLHLAMLKYKLLLKCLKLSLFLSLHFFAFSPPDLFRLYFHAHHFFASKHFLFSAASFRSFIWKIKRTCVVYLLLHPAMLKSKGSNNITNKDPEHWNG